MAASTLRFAIIVALVVGGVVVINQAFPDTNAGETGALPGDGGTPVASESPSPTTEPPEEPRNTPSPTVAGTVIVVVNASGVEGLAADTTGLLVEEFDYEGLEPGTAPSLSDTTTIYYRSRQDKVEADFLENDRFFRQIGDTIRVARLPAGEDVPEGAQLAIYIGTDYASSL
ncbi:MAG: LytR C-terminal domain-containing protein [Actinomycetota bacterium]